MNHSREKVAAGDLSVEGINVFTKEEVKHNDIVYLQLTESLAKDLRYILKHKEVHKSLRHELHKADYQASVELILKNLESVIGKEENGQI